MVDDIITSCAGFEWDEGNSNKSWQKHGIASSECEQVFFNRPLLLLDDASHSQREKRFHALGKTNADKKLFIVFTVRADRIRVISARAMSRKERQIYEKT